jgi:hypothetical protein
MGKTDAPKLSGVMELSHVNGIRNRDHKDDYLVLDPKTGALKAWLNRGPDPLNIADQWHWEPTGEIATGLGPGANVRFADIDGDGVGYVFIILVCPS